MTNTRGIIFVSMFFFGCTQNDQESTVDVGLDKQDTTIIAWKPIPYNTLIASIKDSIHFSGDDTLKYFPSDRDLILDINYTGKLQEYLNHGKIIISPYDSSAFIQRIDDTTFKLRVNKLKNDCRIGLIYSLTFNKPYLFSYIFDGKTYEIRPDDTTGLYVRWLSTLADDSLDYY